MCFGGGSQKVTQTTKQELSPEQRELLNLGMGMIKPTVGNLPTPPGVAGLDPASESAQQGILGKAGPGGLLDMLGQGAASGTGWLASGGVLDVNNNPALRGAVDAAIRPLTENFQNVVMPGVRGGAIQAGALGSSKARQAGDYASSTYLRSVGDTSSKMLNEAYGQNLEAMLKGIALTPQSQSAALFPEVARDTVGQQRRQLLQQQMQSGFDQEMFPFNMGLQLIGASAATPGGGTTGTVTGAQPQSNPLMQGLGGLAAMLAFL